MLSTQILLFLVKIADRIFLYKVRGIISTAPSKSLAGREKLSVMLNVLYQAVNLNRNVITLN